MNVELLEEKNCSATYKVNGTTTVLIWTIIGGQIATSLVDYNQTARWNNIPDGQSEWAPPKLDWIEDQAGFELWLETAIQLQAELDARPKISYKEAFKLDHDILIVEVELKQRYVSVCANLICPVLESDAIACNNRMLEDCDLPQETIDECIDTLEFFDNSLYCNELYYNNETYLYDSIACGQLCEEIKKASPKFSRLLELHLKDDQKSYYEAVDIVKSFGTVDLDAQIESIAYELIDELSCK